KTQQFGLSLPDFLALSINEKVKLLEEFKSSRADVIDALFKAGYVWVLFLGDDNTPVRKERDRQKVLTDNEIRKLAQQTKRVPYHFFSDTVADDFDNSSACSTKTEATGYPTLVIEYRNHTFEVHFDTGLYQTHFDNDFCELVGFTNDIQFPGLGTIP